MNLNEWNDCSYLSFRQTELQGQVKSLTHGQVARCFEFVLQGDQLLVGEGGACAARLAATRMWRGAS